MTSGKFFEFSPLSRYQCQIHANSLSLVIFWLSPPPADVIYGWHTESGVSSQACEVAARVAARRLCHLRHLGGGQRAPVLRQEFP